MNSTIENKTKSVEDNIDSLSKKTKNLNNQLEKFSKSEKNLDNKIKAIEINVNSLSGTTKNLNNQLEKFSKSEKNLDNKIKAIETNVNSLGGTTKNLNNQLEKINKLENKLDNKAKSIKSKLISSEQLISDKTKSVEFKLTSFEKLISDKTKSVEFKLTSSEKLISDKTKSVESKLISYENLIDKKNIEFDKKINDFNVRFFKGSDDNCTGESYEEKILQLEIDTTDKVNKLTSSIESLLPSALSAGLASAYRIQKESYNKQLKWTNRGIYFSFFLLFLLGIINILLADYFINLSFESFIKRLALQVTAIFAIIWFLIFSISRLNKLTRLQQEYSHKESLLSSYSNFKEQIELLKNKDEYEKMLTKLMKISLDAVEFNPAKILEKNDKPEIPTTEILNKITDMLKSITTKKQD